MDTITFFPKIAIRIIKEQERIIGPVAWAEAGKVQGLYVIDKAKGELSFDGDAKEVINRLVNQYARLFGKASNEVCKEAVQDLIAELPTEEVPLNLK
jgi:hypothetical protein